MIIMQFNDVTLDIGYNQDAASHIATDNKESEYIAGMCERGEQGLQQISTC